MYTAVKHIHLFMIACSVLLFIVRYALMMVDSDLRNKAFLNVCLTLLIQQCY